MLGKTNSAQGDVKPSANTLVAYYRATYAVSTPSAEVVGYLHDYLSISSPTYTVLKPFKATLVIFGKGTYNVNGSSRVITYTFKKNGATLYSGTIGNAGGSVTHESVAFSRGDTFSISGSKTSDSGTGTVTYGDTGFVLKFEE